MGENKAQERIGEKRKANNGMWMTIVAYRRCSDLDVQFEDGTLVKNKSYSSFKEGCIKHPSIEARVYHNQCRVGETKKAKNGMEMTIIAYRKAIDIDIQFEDGIVVANKTYSSFKDGNIRHPNINTRFASHQNRIGETNFAKNGLKMTIISYRNSDDIDIRFEDGVIVKNKAYSSFKDGNIAHPTLSFTTTSFPEAAILYYLYPLGFRKMNRGYFSKFNPDFKYKELDIFNEELMTAIEYDGFFFHKTRTAWKNDNEKDRICQNCEHKPIEVIRIREEGLKPTKSSKTINIVRKNNKDIKELEHIIHSIVNIISKKMNIRLNLDIDIERDHKKISKLKNIPKYNDRIGEIGTANNGMDMVIIDYRGSDDIDIQFEDGFIVTHKSYNNFKHGSVGHPDINTRFASHQNRIGETNFAKNGMEMTIIAYRSCHDIDVQFEDGAVVNNKSYTSFKKGSISHPTIQTKTSYKKNRVGETNIATNGMKMTIVAYRGHNDLDIQFEDGIIKNTTYYYFKKGAISHPKKQTRVCKNQNRIGETSTAKNGLKMTIVAYRGSNDIDIQFEDGVIVKNKSYANFKRGRIGHLEIKTKHSYIKDRTGETNIAKNGLKMTIITYRDNKDVDILFEDGIVVKNKLYSSFKRGTIKHPSINTKTCHFQNYINKTSIANNGMRMTIVSYRGNNDIDIQFEDGTIVKNKSYANFRHGTIAHPNVKIKQYTKPTSKSLAS